MLLRRQGLDQCCDPALLAVVVCVLRLDRGPDPAAVVVVVPAVVVAAADAAAAGGVAVLRCWLVDLLLVCCCFLRTMETRSQVFQIAMCYFAHYRKLLYQLP